MKNGIDRAATSAEAHSVADAGGAWAAVVRTESSIAQVIDVGGAPHEIAVRHNSFGDALVVAPAGEAADGASRVRRAAERMSQGERVALLASTRELLPARDVMAHLATQRLPAVFHAFEASGAEEALALAELGWGLLFASDLAESVDLTLAARRAAEDSGTPFVVVHDLLHAGRAALTAALDSNVLTSFIGPAETRVRRVGDAGHPVHVQVGARAFAERAPFALASALRELEGLTGRKGDVVTRSPVGAGADAPLVLVGLGALGDLALAAVPPLRAAGHDVGGMKLTAFRPFPGPRVVRTLARALAVTVIEHRDAPLAQSNLVTREVKAAFADAITWAPGYPGVGRVPRIHAGVTRPSSKDLAPSDVDAVVRNMLAGDQGTRLFVLGGDASQDLDEGRVSSDDASRGSVRG